MLTRGIGEIANLLWVFERESDQFARWKTASERERRYDFAPGAVRKRLSQVLRVDPPIDDERYWRLCEVERIRFPALRRDITPVNPS
jgi:hypothetical protein